MSARTWLAAMSLFIGGAAPAQDARVLPLFETALAARPDQRVAMSIVEYPPGGSSKPHRHEAQVFVYVLAGAMKMQVRGGPLRTLVAGDTFYEKPDDEHLVSANASATEPARFLVFMIRPEARTRDRPEK